jgi:SOS regulatory protein LexA
MRSMTAPHSTPRQSSDAAREITQRRAASLVGFYQERSRMPSYSEMAGLFGVRSKNAVSKIVAKLEAQGLLYRDETGRCLLQRAGYGIRRVGTVEAGFPSPAEEELGDCISLDEMLIQNRAASFLLTVTGDSMSEAGIMPGDMVVVDRGIPAKHGDIVIATVDGQWTIKYLHKKGGRVFLMAANPKYQPIYAQQEMTIHGVVRSCVRRYR